MFDRDELLLLEEAGAIMPTNQKPAIPNRIVVVLFRSQSHLRRMSTLLYQFSLG